MRAICTIGGVQMGEQLEAVHKQCGVLEVRAAEAGESWQAISAGGDHTLAVTFTGEVYGWGMCGGAMAECDVEPRLQPDLGGRASAIGCGDEYCAALTPNGGVAWGGPQLGASHLLVGGDLGLFALSVSPDLVTARQLPSLTFGSLGGALSTSRVFVKDVQLWAVVVDPTVRRRGQSSWDRDAGSRSVLEPGENKLMLEFVGMEREIAMLRRHT